MTKRARYPTFRAWLDTQWDPNYDGDPDIPSLLNTNNLIANRPLKTVNTYSLEGVGNLNLTKADVGLSNADNTSDINKPISTATQTALNTKQSTLVSGTNIKTVNSNSIVGSGNVSVGTVTSILPIEITNEFDTDNTFHSSVINPTTTPTIILNIPHASDVTRGIVSLGNQVFEGFKTFLKKVTFQGGFDFGTSKVPIENGGTNSGTELTNGKFMWSQNGKIVEAPDLPNGHLFFGNQETGYPTVGDFNLGYGLVKAYLPGDFALYVNLFCEATSFSTPVTTTSLVPVTLLSLTVQRGRFLCFFSSTMSNTNSDKQGKVCFYVNGIQYPQTERQELANGDRKFHIGTMVYANAPIVGDNTIEVKWDVVANTGTAYDAQLIALRLSDPILNL